MLLFAELAGEADSHEARSEESVGRRLRGGTGRTFGSWIAILRIGRDLRAIDNRCGGSWADDRRRSAFADNRCRCRNDRGYVALDSAFCGDLHSGRIALDRCRRREDVDRITKSGGCGCRIAEAEF